MTPRPNKRHCGGGETLALQMLQDTLRGELSRERAELRNEINRALKGVTARVDAIEKGLQQHGSRTLQAVKTLTTLQAEQGEKIQTIITDTAVLGQRLAALEGKVRDIQSAGSSTSTGLPNTLAADVLDKANAMARDLKLEISLQDAFVPGVRRGFVLIPLKPRADETEEEMRQRAQACIRRGE